MDLSAYRPTHLARTVQATTTPATPVRDVIDDLVRVRHHLPGPTRPTRLTTG